ncbi:hypothetical protein JCM9140_1223 [Halalkalibacter wakoensis JCM 9140]|uniref:Branched-chain amino acid transporter n=1 Tax=Halalkalibacter wakoensis JCM 9140 TaxID=1236970 RepID=W4PZH2_9BACI|nr:AzlD domain-containing protein [Halalkalibacter wakoensis]GAE25241.1 hypothetical protein JCM9140_1223 [Halalkalibacter wakoensis JCM 9140]
MSLSLILIIAGMAIVTYIPRMLPLVFLNIDQVPNWVQAILRNVPYAALGALIFPGILYVHENIWYGIIGGATALLVAYIGANLIIVVMSSIAVLMIFSVFF